MEVNDPFQQVLQDTREQIVRLNDYLRVHQVDDEVLVIVRDVQETIVDLDRTVLILKRQGTDTKDAEEEINSIREQLQHIKNNIPPNGQSTTDNTATDTAMDDNVMGQDTMAQNIQQQMLQEQDVHLDTIHHTMKNLHLQAETMGQELEDQGQLLDDLDNNMDSLTNKLSRSTKQLEWVYEKNKERINDCCISLLVVALIILLVLAFIA